MPIDGIFAFQSGDTQLTIRPVQEEVRLNQFVVTALSAHVGWRGPVATKDPATEGATEAVLKFSR
ncbi:MAG: hypothetical protein DHS20C11_11040 [Lysobacteraceae bacterium]|nr:MAG: hypothetical protein DHS20C11_11040 [Xanthomonadaceae bacterium]